MGEGFKDGDKKGSNVLVQKGFFQVEISWRQIYRKIWFTNCDRNTKLFHRMADDHRRNYSLKIKVNGT